MSDLTITIIGKYISGNTTLFTAATDFDLLDTDIDGIKSDLEDAFIDEEGQPFTAPDSENIELEVDNWQEIPKEYQDLKTVWEYVEAVNDHEKEIVDAAIYCGISLDDIEEAYSGEFDSDEDFARDMAEQTGSMNKKDIWPYTCIDWEFAAKELMYDYSEHNGHYFRNL